MNELQVFNYQGAAIRTVEKDGEAWFIAKDVCDVLELSNITEALRSLDEDELSSVILKSGSQNREMKLISEPGLYALVLKSRKAEAKEFSRWVRHEVLPSIRKHGGYLTPDKTEELIANPDLIIQLAQALKEERTKTAALEAKVAEDKPAHQGAHSL